MSGLSFNQRSRPAIVAAAALLFLWPALVNGGAFFNADSIGYIRGADAVLSRALGPSARTPWSSLSAGAAHAQTLPPEAAPPAPRAEASFFYGLIAHLGARTGGFWLTIGLQALAAAFALDLCCRALNQRSIRVFLGAAIAAALLTPLAFNVDCVAPDVWIAIAVLVVAAVAAGGERLRPLDYLAALLIVTFAAVTQTPVLAALVAMIVSAASLYFLRRRRRFSFGAPIALLGLSCASLALAINAVAAFNPMADERPDGTPAVHVSSPSSAAAPALSRIRTWNGLKGFVLSGVDQLGSFSMDEFNDAPVVRQSISRWMAPPERARWQATWAYQEKWPVRAMDLGLIGLSIASLGGLCLLVFTTGRGRMMNQDELTRRLMIAAWVVVAGMMANALACGGFSDVSGRQQVCILAPLLLVGIAAWAVLVVRQTQLMVQLYATTNLEPSKPAA